VIAVDTNLLVYAHREATPEHKAAQRALERAVARSEGWGFTIGNILEFWSVVTHPEAKGRPSTPSEAKKYLRNLVEQGGATVWLPGQGLDTRLLSMAAQLKIAGPRVFDLQIAMTARDHGATEIWTHDAGFVRLPGLTVHDPLNDE
jgi:toxin-antitoxin system PIN domain toxin